MRTLAGWLGSLPEASLTSDRWLLYWRGVTRPPVDTTSSRQDFDRAFDRFSDQRVPAGIALAWAGVVESVLYEWNDFTLLDPWIAKLDAVHQQVTGLLDRTTESRVAFAAFGALMFRSPDHPEMRAWMTRALALAFQTDDISQRVVAGSHLAHDCFWTGDLKRAQQIIDRIASSPGLRDAARLTRINWMMIEAVNAWHLADTDACLQIVAEGLKEAVATDVHLWDCVLLAQGV